MQVHFVVAACENMISGTGMRPGDIVTASNGKTIEVRIYLVHDFFLNVISTYWFGYGIESEMCGFFIKFYIAL